MCKKSLSEVLANAVQESHIGCSELGAEEPESPTMKRIKAQMQEKIDFLLAPPKRQSDR